LEHLNNIPLRSGGFIHEKYSPASFETDRVERRYFTEVNAARIDTIRDEIELLRTRLTLAEHALLISDLLRAASSVANIAGTYGSYLKDWKSKALATIQLRPAQFTDGQREGHQVWSLDAVEAGARARADIVYADPPYTKRQYAAYYHVLETIALNDRPVLTGSTGLREWQTHSSDFCYKQKAPRALQQLVESLSCRHFFLSYNDDGQIPHDVILQILGGYGGVIFREKVIRRYKSSRQSHKGPGVVERLYHLSIQ
jgi:adenine-specific DNA-methyltransferase